MKAKYIIMINTKRPSVHKKFIVGRVVDVVLFGNAVVLSSDNAPMYEYIEDFEDIEDAMDKIQELHKKDIADQRMN